MMIMMIMMTMIGCMTTLLASHYFMHSEISLSICCWTQCCYYSVPGKKGLHILHCHFYMNIPIFTIFACVLDKVLRS